MALQQLEARWSGRDEFIEVDFVSGLDEAKGRAITFQLDHNVRSVILWTTAEGVHWGHSKQCTFRVKPI